MGFLCDLPIFVILGYDGYLSIHSALLDIAR